MRANIVPSILGSYSLSLEGKQKFLPLTTGRQVEVARDTPRAFVSFNPWLAYASTIAVTLLTCGVDRRTVAGRAATSTV